MKTIGEGDFAIKILITRGKDIVTIHRFKTEEEAEEWAKWNYSRSLVNGNLPPDIKIINLYEQHAKETKE